VLLTFLPGFLLGSNSKVDKKSVGKSSILGRVERLLLDVCSIAMDLAYPPLGISDPISLFPLTTTLSVVFGWLESCRLQDWRF